MTPTQATMIEDFPKLRTWVVVGVSTDQEKYGNKIYRALRDAGYHVYGVNPKLTTIEGDPCYATLEALPTQPDVVDFVVPPAVTEAMVEDCIRLGFKRLWFQPGSESEAAIQKAQAAGLHVVHDACILIQKQDWS